MENPLTIRYVASPSAETETLPADSGPALGRESGEQVRRRASECGLSHGFQEHGAAHVPA